MSNKKTIAFRIASSTFVAASAFIGLSIFSKQSMKLDARPVAASDGLGGEKTRIESQGYVSGAPSLPNLSHNV